MSMASYFRPTTLEDALSIKAREPVQVLAGGTDVYPIRTTREAWGDTSRTSVLDITSLPGLRGIEAASDSWRIGALTTWTDILDADLPPCFDGLKLAAAEVGGLQIQNRGTLAGNLVNASPAADGVPPLLALEAGIELAHANGRREVPLGHFIDDYRHTVLEPRELVTAIVIPRPAESAISHFLKLGARRYMVISIAMASAVIETGRDGVIAKSRVALGACSAVAQRLTALESALDGQPLDASIAQRVGPQHFAHLEPIDDIRASAAYRSRAAQHLVGDMLVQMADQTRYRIT